MKLIVLLMIINFNQYECNSQLNNKTIDERVKLLETTMSNFTTFFDKKLNNMENMIEKLTQQRFPNESFQGKNINDSLSKDIVKDIAQLAESQCNEWQAYRDIKCVKIIDYAGLESYENAINICHQQTNNSKLITINSLDEQRFLTNYIFNTSQVVENVWIAAKYIDSQYRWINGLNLTFTNWAEGYPKNITDNCVQMHADPGSVGKWVDGSCKRKNLVVCQKLPLWSIPHIQESLLNIHETVYNLKQNIVPIGFIYAQLPNEKSPNELWPWMTWNEITSSYAGLFFRAEGGNSSSFGSNQEENTPTITQHQSDYYKDHTSVTNYMVSSITNGVWSNYVYTGSDYGGNHVASRYFKSNGEVRPRNTAIRIWKRYG